jgi:Leucine-rich repeat (LRR) protein
VQEAVNSLGASASAGIAACQQLQALTAPALAACLCTQQLGAVSYLNLHGLGLQELAPLQGLPALEALLLSCNRLSSVQGLGGLSSLTQLDLSFNCLSSSSSGLAALLRMPRLAELDLSSNQLAAAETWLQAASAASGQPLGQRLQRLDLRANAATAVKGHRSLLLQHLTALRWLDGREVAPGGCQGAGPLQRHCYTAQGAPAASACSSGDGAGGGGGWRQQVAAVLMDQCSLRCLPRELAQLPALTRASFADNHLQSVAGLQGCTALQDLCLAHNSLAGLSQLASLPGLVKLDVAHNQISSLEPLAALTVLEQVRGPACVTTARQCLSATAASNLPAAVRITPQLSVEGNAVASLAGLEGLASLLELYAGDNQLADMRQLKLLRWAVDRKGPGPPQQAAWLHRCLLAGSGAPGNPRRG